MMLYLLTVFALVAVADFQKNVKPTGCLGQWPSEFATYPHAALLGYEGVEDQYGRFPVGNRMQVTCLTGPLVLGANRSYCQPNGEWKPKPGRCPPLNCSVEDLLENRNFRRVKLTKPDVNNTGIALHEETAKAVCCGRQYPKDPKRWPYTFTCKDGTWYPKTECNDDQYAFCNVEDLVEKKFFVAAERVTPGIKNTPYQFHGKNATAVCCGLEYPKDPKKWPHKFICEHGKWLPDIECNDEI